MIKNFEKQTYELTKLEATKIYPLVLKMLKTKKGRDKAIKGIKIREELAKKGYPLVDSRIRKIVHKIRVSKDIPNLIASSNGYYVAQSYAEMKDYINSLKSRQKSILEVITALNKQLKEME